MVKRTFAQSTGLRWSFLDLKLYVNLKWIIGGQLEMDV